MCLAAGRDCQYAAFPHELQAAAMQRKHDMLEERMVHHEDLYHSLKTRRPDEVEEILHQIQAGKDIMSVMENLEEGSLPLQLTSPQASYAPLSTNPSATPSNPMIANTATDNPSFASSQAHYPGSEQRFIRYRPPHARLTSRSVRDSPVAVIY